MKTIPYFADTAAALDAALGRVCGAMNKPGVEDLTSLYLDMRCFHQRISI